MERLGAALMMVVSCWQRQSAAWRSRAYHRLTDPRAVMPRLIRLTGGILAALLAVIPAQAQVYKWVDEHGVTNYSSDPPPAVRKGGPKTATVADRISVYAPEPGIQREIRAVSLGKDRILSDRIDALEREAAERQASEFAASAEARAAQAAYAQCQADRRVDCDYNSGYYPYGWGGVLTVVHRRPLPRNPGVGHSRSGTEKIARLHPGGKVRQPGFPP
jgi:hypothetical protein